MAGLPAPLRARTAVMWLVLVVATVMSLLLGAEDLVQSAKLASVLVIAIAFVKVRLVGMYFMELRDAPTPLRLLFEGYCVVVGATLIVMFLLL